MTYPNTIPDFRTALLAYDPPAEVADAIYIAQGQGSPVVAAAATFDTLKDAEGLDTDGRRLLAGAAYLIAANGWHGKAGEAAVVLSEVVGTLPVEAAPAPEVSEDEPA